MQSNLKSIEFYQKLAKNIDDPSIVKFSNDNTNFDIEFIKKYANKQNSLLDIGSGTGLIINKLTKSFRSIIAVELFEEFSKFIEGDNISIINQNITDFVIKEKFYVITMFGTAHYFDESESWNIYSNIYSMLDCGGVFILKNQFGINKTKTVYGSKHLGKDYYAQYRLLDFEISRLKDIGYRAVETHDIYPPESNKWNDTHFYALVCKK